MNNFTVSDLGLLYDAMACLASSHRFIVVELHRILKEAYEHKGLRELLILAKEAYDDGDEEEFILDINAIKETMDDIDLGVVTHVSRKGKKDAERLARENEREMGWPSWGDESEVPELKDYWYLDSAVVQASMADEQAFVKEEPSSCDVCKEVTWDGARHRMCEESLKQREPVSITKAQAEAAAKEGKELAAEVRRMRLTPSKWDRSDPVKSEYEGWRQHWLLMWGDIGKQYQADSRFYDMKTALIQIWGYVKGNNINKYETLDEAQLSYMLDTLGGR